MKEITITPGSDGNLCMRILHIKDDSEFKLVNLGGNNMYVAEPILKNRYGEEYNYLFDESYIMRVEFVMFQYRVVCFDHQATEAIEKVKNTILGDISKNISFLNSMHKEYERKIEGKEVGKYNKNSFF